MGANRIFRGSWTKTTQRRFVFNHHWLDFSKMVLCRTCAATLQSIVIGAEPNRREEYPYHTSANTFLDAAAAKCYVCSRLHRQADQEFHAMLEEMAEVERLHHGIIPQRCPQRCP